MDISREATRDPAWPEAVEIFDTTLRDGSQFEGIALTADDKLKIAEQLDSLGVHYIEGGWPGSNPRDDEFFARAAAGELKLTTSELVAFGSTRRPNGKVDVDETLANLLRAETGICRIVAKSWDYHAPGALRMRAPTGRFSPGEPNWRSSPPVGSNPPMRSAGRTLAAARSMAVSPCRLSR